MQAAAGALVVIAMASSAAGGSPTDEIEARLLVDQGRFAAAASLLEGTATADGPAWAFALLARARVGTGDGTLPGSLGLAEEAVARAATPTEEAEGWEALAAVLAEASDLESAEAQLVHALDLRRGSSGSRPAEIARAVEALALVRAQRGRFDLDPLLAEVERLRADGRPSARSVELRAYQQREQADYPRALEFARQARDLRERAHADDPELVTTHNLEGELEWFLGRYEESRTCHLRALGQARRVLGETHPGVGRTLGDLALAESQLGDMENARVHHLEAVRILEARYGPDHTETVGRRMNLANFEKQQGEYARALALYEQSLAGFDAQSTRHDEYVATVKMNLALLHQQLGDRRDARALLEEVLSTWERTHGPGHPFLVHPLDALATLESESGADEAARVHLQRTTGILRKDGRSSPLQLALAYARLAAVEDRVGMRTAAAGHAQNAQRVVARARPSEGLQVARVLEVLGARAAAASRWREAVRLFDDERARLEAIFGPAHPYVAESRARLANALAQAGLLRRAVDEAAQAEEARRRHLRITARHLSETQALLFAARRRSSLDVLVGAAHRSRDPARVARAFEAVWRARALVLDEMATRHRRTVAAADPAARALIEELEVARRRLAHLVWRASDPTDASAARVREAEARIEQLERRLAMAAPGRDDGREPDTSVLAAHLPRHAVLVSLARSGPPESGGYVAFVLRRGHATPDLVPLGTVARIDALASEWRQALADRLRATDDDGRESRAAAGLHAALWRPLAHALRGARLALVVPEGPLALVNLAALPDGRGGYLLDGALVVHTLSSERDLLSDPPERGNGSLLALGGPDFGDARADREALSPRATGAPCDRGRLADLPQSALEARDVGRLWTEGPSRVLTGGEATEAAFRRLAPGQSALHLATHAFVCPRASVANPLQRSGLALAGANRSGDAADDGIVTAAEVSGLDLRAVRWVVLSTCGSGLGDVQAEEGVLGLRRAFTIAGARTLVTSLWPVDDTLARWYMRELYEARSSGAAASSAAWQASRALRVRLRQHGKPDVPALWAPFATSGDWR
jgi:CHAT domain-containing protein